jgi:hypothetical protein
MIFGLINGGQIRLYLSGGQPNKLNFKRYQFQSDLIDLMHATSSTSELCYETFIYLKKCLNQFVFLLFRRCVPTICVQRSPSGPKKVAAVDSGRSSHVYVKREQMGLKNRGRCRQVILTSVETVYKIFELFKTIIFFIS